MRWNRRTQTRAPLMVFLLWLAVGALPFAAAAGTAGDLDTSFGSGGASAFALDDTDLVLLGIQSDGKMVLGASVEGPVVDGIRTTSWLITRRNADGSADSFFGTNGAVSLFGDVRNDRLIDGVVDASDRIVCAGRALIETTTTSGRGKKQKTTTTRLNAFTVARLQADGGLDTTFGSDGVVHTSVPGAASGGGQAWAVMVQGNGKIVAAGQAFDVSSSSGGSTGGKGKKKRGGGSSTTSDAIVVVRYESNGALDTSFGSGGVTVHDATSEDDKVVKGAVAVQSTGEVIVGSFVQASGWDGWVVTRYAANGAVDSTFDRLTVAGGYLEGLQVDGSDRILVVGSQLDSSSDDEPVLVRYLKGGAVDTSFGTGGVATPSFTSPARCFSAALQADGKVVVMCAVGTDGSVDIEAVPLRYSASGSLDTGFGTGGEGEALGDVGFDVYPLFELELDSYGNLVTAGVSIDSSDGSIDGYVARWCGS